MNQRNIKTVEGSGGGGLNHRIFEKIISLENLLCAWREFRKGKRKKSDVARFEFNLEDNIFKLYEELVSGTYKSEPYEAFFVKDPKLRHIHKAGARDRLVHQALFRVLYPLFDKYFIYDSYSSRNRKGTHAGARRLESFIRRATGNWTRSAWCLKCDVRKFFDSIDHRILLGLIRMKVKDEKVLNLIETIVHSFEKNAGKGLPLGNVTSQLFANVYMNEFDQYVKHILKASYYARYCDDFVIVNDNKEILESYIPQITEFLDIKLQLRLHPNKVEVRKVRQGIDFLGQVILPYRNVLRTKTKKRILRKVMEVKESDSDKMLRTVASYKGLLSHGENRQIISKIDIILGL